KGWLHHGRAGPIRLPLGGKCPGQTTACPGWNQGGSSKARLPLVRHRPHSGSHRRGTVSPRRCWTTRRVSLDKNQCATTSDQTALCWRSNLGREPAGQAESISRRIEGDPSGEEDRPEESGRSLGYPF